MACIEDTADGARGKPPLAVVCGMVYVAERDAEGLPIEGEPDALIEVADIVSVAPSWESRRIGDIPASVSIVEGMDRQIGWVRAGAESVGRRFEDIELSVTAMPVTVTPGAATMEDFGRAGAPHGISPQDSVDAPYLLVGSVDQIAETVRQRHQRWGVSNWVVPVEVADAFAPVVERVLSGT